MDRNPIPGLGFWPLLLLCAMCLATQCSAQPNIAVSQPSGLQPNGFTKETTISFTLSDLPDGHSGFLCSLDKEIASSCTSPVSHSNLPAGEHTLEVSFATDEGVAASGDDASSTFTWTIDKTPPAQPSITTENGAINGATTSETSPTYTLTSTGADSFQCKLTPPSGVPGQPFRCRSSVTLGAPNALTEGAYTLEVTASDAAGNEASATISFTIDTKAPGVPTFTTEPGPFTNVKTPAFAFSLVDTGTTLTYSCGLTDSANRKTPITCTAGVSITIDSTTAQGLSGDGLAEGRYTLHVQATDQAGNKGEKATYIFTVDTTAPDEPTFTAKPATFTNEKMPAFSIEDTATTLTYSCNLTDSADTETPITCSAGGSITIDSTTTAQVVPEDGLAEGQYTLHVQATDQAGNKGPTATSMFTVDTTKPANTTILQAQQKDTADNTPSFLFSATDPANPITFKCRLTGVLNLDEFTCPSSLTLDSTTTGVPPTGLQDGAYVLHVQAFDSASNPGSEVTSGFTVDTVDPAAPTITPNQQQVTKERTPSFTFAVASDTGSAVTYRCRLSGVVTVNEFTCASPLILNSNIEGIDDDGLGEGDHKLHIQAVDAAGNRGTESTTSITVDTTEPKNTAILPALGQQSDTADNTPSFTFSATDPATPITYECRLTGVVNVNAFTCPSSLTLDSTTVQGVPPSGLQDGAYVLHVNATDNAGNTGSEVTSSFTVDKTRPLAPVISAQQGNITNVVQPKFRLASNPGNDSVNFMCRLDSANSQGSEESCNAVATFGSPTPLAEGRYTLHVKATDRASNVGPAATETFTIDTTPPSPPTIMAAQSNLTNNRLPGFDFNVTGDEVVIYRCTLAKGLATPGAFPCSATTIIASPESQIEGQMLSGLKDGSYTLRVNATDIAGNTGGMATQAFTVDGTPPLVEFQDSKDPPPTHTNILRTRLYLTADEPVTRYECKYHSTNFPNASTTWMDCLDEEFEGNRTDNDLIATLDVVKISADRKSGISMSDYNGQHGFDVRGIDAAGNTGTPWSWNFNVDLNAPKVTIPADQPIQPVNIYSPNFKWSADNYSLFNFSANEKRVAYICTVQLDGSLNTSSDCSPPNVRVDTILPGQYTLTVTAVDRAQNEGSKVFSWTAAPNDPETNVTSAQNFTTLTNKAHQSVNFIIGTPVPRLRAECSVDRLQENGTVLSEGDWFSCVERSQTMDGPASVMYTANTEDFLKVSDILDMTGYYNFNARVIDVFNRTSDIASFQFSVDNVEVTTRSIVTDRAAGKASSASSLYSNIATIVAALLMVCLGLSL